MLIVNTSLTSITIPNSITIIYGQTFTGCTSHHKDDTKVYASNGHVMVSSESEIQDVRIFDITGKLLKTVAVSGNSTTVNITDYSTGVYMVQVHTANGYVTRKVVK